MGLDVTAYRKIRKAACDRWDECWPEHANLWPNPDFIHAAGSIEEGCYAYEASERGPSLSYSGYDAWREWLAYLALGVSPREVWTQPDRFAGKPFVELVNFSDCEGVIGPEPCGKLASDFAAWDGRARDAAKLNPLNYERYAAFRRAFEFAADGGAVDFH